MFITMEDIDRMIREDIPYLDLTSRVLGIREQRGSVTYFTREDCVASGVREVEQVFARLGVKLSWRVEPGERVRAGAGLIAGEGRAEDLHMAWKVGQNILDHCCGIATRTRAMVDAAAEVNPRLAILTTRKMFPGTKTLATGAIVDGGALPHRLGISETILIFHQHMEFSGGPEAVAARLEGIKGPCCEKKVIVEASSAEEAELFCRAGADGIQLDKLPLPELEDLTRDLKKRYPSVILLAAGGISEKNVKEYARLSLDGVVTSSLYHAKPVDIGVRMKSHG